MRACVDWPDATGSRSDRDRGDLRSESGCPLSSIGGILVMSAIRKQDSANRAAARTIEKARPMNDLAF